MRGRKLAYARQSAQRMCYSNSRASPAAKRQPSEFSPRYAQIDHRVVEQRVGYGCWNGGSQERGPSRVVPRPRTRFPNWALYSSHHALGTTGSPRGRTRATCSARKAVIRRRINRVHPQGRGGKGKSKAAAALPSLVYFSFQLSQRYQVSSSSSSSPSTTTCSFKTPLCVLSLKHPPPFREAARQRQVGYTPGRPVGSPRSPKPKYALRADTDTRPPNAPVRTCRLPGGHALSPLSPPPLISCTPNHAHSAFTCPNPKGDTPHSVTPGEMRSPLIGQQ